ncbi:MAG: methyltransferase domain-containing protein [Methylacidiphilales bacterium]|nr:methyltransferase domain-containing protein [Candidatus Methylacidiphilales bacterium]
MELKVLVNRILSKGDRILSKGELAALRSLLREFYISHLHRRGLREIRRRSLSRPARINLGSGTFRKDGFLNVDMFPGGDLTLDLRRDLPFDSDCCELIFSEHFFEHLDYPDAATALFRECLRILKPGGLLRLSVPDTEWPLKEYAKDDPEAGYFRMCKLHSWWHPAYCTTRMEHINYHFRQNHDHLFAYDEETARKILENVGFRDVQRSAFDPRFDSPHHEVGSLFMTAVKPRI